MQENTPGGGERRPSAGRKRGEGEAEIEKGSQRDGVWEGWPWAGETPGDPRAEVGFIMAIW